MISGYLKQPTFNSTFESLHNKLALKRSRIGAFTGSSWQISDALTNAEDSERNTSLD